MHLEDKKFHNYRSHYRKKIVGWRERHNEKVIGMNIISKQFCKQAILLAYNFQ
jgi:hypothetical protein